MAAKKKATRRRATPKKTQTADEWQRDISGVYGKQKKQRGIRIEFRGTNMDHHEIQEILEHAGHYGYVDVVEIKEFDS